MKINCRHQTRILHMFCDASISPQEFQGPEGDRKRIISPHRKEVH